MGNIESNLMDMIQRVPLEFSHHCYFTASNSKYPHSPNFEFVAFDIRYEYQYRPSGVLGALGSGVLATAAGNRNGTNPISGSMDKIGKSIDSFREVTVFKYFDPTSTRDVIVRVEVFFSTFNPDNPLVIVLTTRDRKKHHYRYRKLGNRPISFNLAPEHFSAPKLKSVLVQENNRINKKLKFKLGHRKNRNIRMVPENREESLLLGNSKGFKMVSYAPFVDMYGGRRSDGGYGGSTNGPFVLYLPELFSVQPKDLTLKNYVDGLYLTNLADKKFDGVTVYYTNPGNLAVLLEFVNGSKRWQFIRKNLESSMWRGVSLGYTNEDELVEGLSEIVTELGVQEDLYDRTSRSLSRSGSIDRQSGRGSHRSVSIGRSLVSTNTTDSGTSRIVERNP